MNNKQAIRKFDEHTGIPETGIYAYTNKKGYLNVYVDGQEYHDTPSHRYFPIFYDTDNHLEIYTPTKTCLSKEVQERYKTERQWKLLGYRVLPNEEPWEMFLNTYRTKTTTDYFRVDQVEKI